jgi:histidyl-tRNA synthetase
MALLTKAPRGTQDVLPSQSYKWQYIEKAVIEVSNLYGFKEIRFPTFEHTELFTRSVGDTTDVVQKEMYTFNDKKDRSITLRPEGTAGTVRAVLQNGLLNEALPQRVCYLTSCFRYEKPQAGRLREFHQFGAELFGSKEPTADAVMISMANDIFKKLKVKNLRLEINSIGCPKCRVDFHNALKSYFENKKDDLCSTCHERLEKNPMRILDCKSKVCGEISKDAPIGLDYLCDECVEHFDSVKASLNAMEIEFIVNPTIVRGLDYYTKTVFEFTSTDIGTQGTVCGGGRYDGLIEMLGEKPSPALGYAMGLERLLMIMEAQGIQIPTPKVPDLYIASMGESASLKALSLSKIAKNKGLIVDFDLMKRGIKAQMKYADKINAKYSIVIGDNELETNKAILKNMTNSQEIEVSLDETMFENVN